MTNPLYTHLSPELPDDLTYAQVKELCDCLRDKAISMNPNVDITKIEIGFGMETFEKNGKRYRNYGLEPKTMYYFSRNSKHPFIAEGR